MEENFQVMSASVSDRGLSEKRPQNEDSFLELTQHGIFAVADGVGGAQAGDVASQMAVEILGEAFANKPVNADAEQVMRVAIERANSAIYQMSHDLPQLATMATTIVALHLSGNIATIGHVGDSRLYRVANGGSISQETADHSVVAEEVRAGRMTPEQAAVHPSRNVISRALGAEATVDVDMKTIMVEPDTSFILCSDGITRHIEDWELESILRSDSDLNETCQRLKQICYDRGAEDNLTAVVVKVNGDAAPAEEIYSVEVEEPEEETVATARSPFDDVAEPIVRHEEILQPLATASVPQEAEPAVVEELPPAEARTELSIEPVPRETSIDEPVEQMEETTAEPALVEPVSAAAPVAAASSRIVTPVDRSYSVVEAEPSRSGFFGSFLSSLLLLILGGALGAAGMYFLFPPRATEQLQQPTPQITEAKYPNIERDTFEESRRVVDKNPQAYIEMKKGDTQNADAADYYLLGRAYLLSGNYFEAKRAFNEAKARLSGADASNPKIDSKTLSTEIALALAVINSGPATESLKKDLAEWASTPNAANSSVNANGSVNANHPTGSNK